MAVLSIGQAVEGKRNNFHLMRLLAALLVIYGHCYPISGNPGPDIVQQVLRIRFAGSLATDTFFVISGFLITGSYLRREHLGNYLWARFLRIMPAFAVCVAICAFVIGPIFSNLALGDYFREQGPYHYVAGNLELGQETMVWSLPGVFAPNRIQVLNGSIWTLPAEVIMYVWVAALGLFTVLRRRWLFNAFFAGLMIYGWLRPDHLWLIENREFVRLGAMFAAGAFCYVNRAQLPNHGALLLAAIALSYVFRTSPAYPVLFGCCEVLFVFWFAYNLGFTGFNRFGDYSYGIYLWGFPSQQIVAALGNELPTYANAILGFLLALSIGICSWHFVEKPAIGLKSLPRRLMEGVRKRLSGQLRSQSRNGRITNSELR